MYNDETNNMQFNKKYIFTERNLEMTLTFSYSVTLSMSHLP